MNYGILMWAVGAGCTALMFISSGCAHKKAEFDRISSTTTPSYSQIEIGNSDLANALGLRTVRFEFDSALLSESAKADLLANSEVLKKNPDVRIQIEGHCDSMGATQYNVALGERRANSAKRYLMDLGIDGARISLISYGEEKPLDASETEEAHSRNRRANFVITAI